MANAKVIIAGQNNIGPAVKSAQSDISSLSNVAQKAGDTLKKAFTITAIVAALKKLGDSCAACFNEFWEAERRYKQLQIAIGDTSSYNKATDTIRKLSRQTLSSKGDVESMVAELAALGKNADEIDRISSAAVYLSNVTGKDLNSSMTTLLNTYNGTTTQLKRLGIDVSNLTKEELVQGAAIDTVIDKLRIYSEELAKVDTRQHLTNIKNSWGDIRQSIGDLVNFTIAPMMAKLDNALSSFNERFNTFVQQAKVELGNLPEVLSKLWSAIKGGFGKFFSIEGIKNFINGIWNLITSKVRLIGNLIGNLGNLVVGVFEQALKGIGNYAMYWITHVTDSIGINISDVINSIGKWLTESPIGKIVDQIVTKATDGVRFIGAIIKNLPSIFKIVLSNIGDMIVALIKSIPEAIKELFLGVIDWVAYVAIKIKNDISDALSAALDPFRAALRWIGISVGDGRTDRTSENEMGANVNSHFSNVASAFSDVRVISREMAEQIDNLLSPTLDKLSINTGETIGQKMAVWTAKSSDEYYKAAQKNFSSIGDFLKDWGQTFLGDLNSDWDDLSSSFSGIFSDVFGEDFEQFVKWFRPFMEEKLKQAGAKSNNATYNSSENANGKSSADAFKDIVSDFGSQLGEAGTVLNSVISNTSKYGALVGGIVTAVHYVTEGFAEVVSGQLAELVKYIIKPLKEIGRIIGELLIPVISAIIPVFRDIADFLIPLFRAIGAALRPIIEIISTLSPLLSIITNVLDALVPVFKFFAKIVVTITGTIQYVIQVLQHWVASVMNWLADLNILGWQPFAGLRMNDPGSPGSYSSFIKNKWSEVDAAFEATPSSSTSTETAVASASYQGATHVTINIYQEAPVVGDGGMRQFARMIRSEFENMSYYGVTT